MVNSSTPIKIAVWDLGAMDSLRKEKMKKEITPIYGRMEARHSLLLIYKETFDSLKLSQSTTLTTISEKNITVKLMTKAFHTEKGRSYSKTAITLLANGRTD